MDGVFSPSKWHIYECCAFLSRIFSRESFSRESFPCVVSFSQIFFAHIFVSRNYLLEEKINCAVIIIRVLNAGPKSNARMWRFFPAFYRLDKQTRQTRKQMFDVSKYFNPLVSSQVWFE